MMSTPSKRTILVQKSPEPVAKPSTPLSSKKRTVTLARNVEASEDMSNAVAVMEPATQTLRRDADGHLLERSMLGSLEDFEPPSVPSPPPSRPPKVPSRGANTIPNLPSPIKERSESNLSISQRSRDAALESHRSAVARQRLLEKRMAQSKAARETEAKQRADHMKTLLVHERIQMSREERVRQRWEAQKRAWSKFRKSMAKHLGRKEEELVVADADDYRAQVEEYDLLEKARPEDQRKSSEWESNLRGGGTKYIMIGNIFSGLFIPISDEVKPVKDVIKRPSAAVRVGATTNRPVTLGGSPSATAASGAGMGSTSRGWRDGKELNKRKKRLAKGIAKLRPHVVTEDMVEGLIAVGSNLFEWAGRSTDLLQLQAERAAAEAAAAEAEEAARLAAEAAADEAAAAAVDQTHVPPGRRRLRAGPWLTLVVVSDAATAPGEAGAGVSADGDLIGLEGSGGGGLAAARGWPRLLFDTETPADATAVLRVANTGTTALYYKWERVDRGGTAALEASVDGAAPEVVALSRFFCPNVAGSVLPGQAEEFVFTFKSPNAGVYRETWQLETVPPANNGATLRIALRGTSTQADEGAPRRESLERRLEAQALRHAMQDILREVVDAVATPRAPPTAEEQQALDAAAFSTHNPGLFYTPATYEALKGVAAEVYAHLGFPPADCTWDGSVAGLEAAIGRVVPPPESPAQRAERLAAEAAAEAARKAEEEAAAAAAAKAKGKKKKGEETPREAAPPPPELSARERVDATRVDLRRRLAEACVGALAPPREDTVLFSMARQLVLEVVEAVPKVVGGVRAAMGLPLRDEHGDVDVVPGEDDDALVVAIRGKQRPRRTRVNSDGEEETDSDVSSSEEEESEEEDSEEEDEAPVEVEPAPGEDAEPAAHADYKIRAILRRLLGDAAARFAGRANEVQVSAMAAMRSAARMDLASVADLSGVDVAGKVAFLRADLDAPLEAVVDPEAAAAFAADARRRRRKGLPASTQEVEVQGWRVADEARIQGAVPTIEALLAGGAKVVVASHLGTPHLPYPYTHDGIPPPAAGDAPPSMAPVAAALGAALGKDVTVVDVGTPDTSDAQLGSLTRGVREDLPAALAAALEASPVVVLGNAAGAAEEFADEGVFGLSSRRGDITAGSGHPLLDATNVLEWSPALVSLWVARQCPGVARQDMFAAYALDWAARELTGADVLRMDAKGAALLGVSPEDVPVVAGGLDAARARHVVEAVAAARAGVVLAVPPVKPRAVGGEEEEAEAGTGGEAAEEEVKADREDLTAGVKEDEEEVEEEEKEGEGEEKLEDGEEKLEKGEEKEEEAKPVEEGKGGDDAGATRISEIADERLVAARTSAAYVAAYRAALSSVCDVFVNDAFTSCGTSASTVVGINPFVSSIAAREVVGRSRFLEGVAAREAALAAEAGGEPSGGGGAPQPAAGRRVAGLGVAKELRAWAPVLQPELRPAGGKGTLLVVGGADVLPKVDAVGTLLAVVDELAVGGVMGALWAHVSTGMALGSTGDVLGDALPRALAAVRRLVGHAARCGVKVRLPVDYVVGSERLVAAPEDDDDDDEETDSDIDSDDEEALAAHAARKAADRADIEAAKAAEAAAAAAPKPLPDEAWDGPGAPPVVAAAFEYEGDTSEVTAAEGVKAGFVMDVGPDTVEAWGERLPRMGTVVVYGPLGVVETADGQAGTKELLSALASATKSGVKSLVVGGSLAAWSREWGVAPALSHVSEGGPATRRLLAGRPLPGVAVLDRKA